MTVPPLTFEHASSTAERAMEDVLAAADLMGLQATGRKMEEDESTRAVSAALAPSANHLCLQHDPAAGCCAQGAPAKDKGPDRRPDLLSEWEVATLDFRFSVGDIVRCSVHGCKDGYQAGTVVQRCYREDEWPTGYYAAVRASSQSLSVCLSLSLPICLSMARPTLCIAPLRSTKCGSISSMVR